MQNRRISGRDVVVTLPSGVIGTWDSINLNVQSGVAAVKDRGRPAGWVYGENSADGDITVPTEELNKLLGEAEAAGSWEQMEAVDATFYASGDDSEIKVEVFGLKLDFPDFKADSKGGENLKHTLKFIVTGEEFIKINGVALARPATD